MSARKRGAKAVEVRATGRAARMTGEPRTTCPYKVSEHGMGGQWLAGWDEANGRTCAECDGDIPPRLDGGAKLLTSAPVYCSNCREMIEAGMGHPLEVVRRLPCGCYLGIDPPAVDPYMVDLSPANCSIHGPGGGPRVWWVVSQGGTLTVRKGDAPAPEALQDAGSPDTSATPASGPK